MGISLCPLCGAVAAVCTGTADYQDSCTIGSGTQLGFVGIAKTVIPFREEVGITKGDNLFVGLLVDGMRFITPAKDADNKFAPSKINILLVAGLIKAFLKPC